MQQAIPFMMIRGGSSKGIFFSATDLPMDPEQRDQLLLSALGRDLSQVDGLGGAHPLTSKVAIVSASTQPDCDVDYLFVQVVVGQNRVDTTPNCGNILSGVGPFAIERGLVNAMDKITTVRVHMLNSGNRCDLAIQTPKGKVKYAGDAIVDGVPGSAAPIICKYKDIAGSVCGRLLPTGHPLDNVDGVPVTCIDNGMPVVVIRAADLDKTGYESPQELEQDRQFCQRLETIRLQAGTIMKLGDVKPKVVPKMCLVSKATNGGAINTRSFIPHRCHSSIGVLGAVSLATACVLKGSAAEAIANLPAGNVKTLSIEHPSGQLSVELGINEKGEVEHAGVLRTARLIAQGELYV